MNSFSAKNVRRLHSTDVLNDDDDTNNKNPLQNPISAQKPPHKPGQTTTKTYILMKTISRISLMNIQLETKQHIRTLNLVFWTII